MASRNVVYLSVIVMLLTVALVCGCAQIGIPPGDPDLTDTKPPELIKAETVDKFHLRLEFNEPIDIASGRDVELYVIEDEFGTPLTVLDVIPSDTVDAIILVTDEQVKGQKYYVSVRNIRDAEGGNPIGRKNSKRFKGSGKDDERAPAVVGTYPPDGSEGICLRPTITIIFTDTMNEYSFVDTITCVDDFGDAVEGDIETGAHRLSFTPKNKFDYNTRYTVIVADNCTDLAGNILYQETTLGFVTISDTEEAIISGRVVPRGTDIDAVGAEVLLVMNPNPNAKDPFVAGRALVREDNSFEIAGVAPTNENVPAYYLIARKDADDDGEFELIGYNDGNNDGLMETLPEIKPADRLRGITLNLEYVDDAGPICSELLFTPNPTNGQSGGYIIASFEDDGTKIADAEFFFDYEGSDGTGLALNPLNGVWGGSKKITADRFVTNIGRYKAAKKGSHTLYAHAKDSKGNWGEFYAYEFTVTGKPKSSHSISGTIDFDLEPTENAIVYARPENSSAPESNAYPVAVTRTDKNGEYKLVGLVPGSYIVEVFGDEDKNEMKGRTEPSSKSHKSIVISTHDVSGIDLTLAFAPSITGGNARMQYYGDERIDLKITASVIDRDSDISQVWAILPDGNEVDLLDDGKLPDNAQNDGIYTYEYEYGNNEIDGLTVQYGDVTIYAQDSFGNIAEAEATGYPGLKISEMRELPTLAVSQTPDGIKISWSEIAEADGGYVAFIIPYDRMDRFTEPGSSEVWSNYQNPLYANSVLAPYDKISDYWAYPQRSVFYIMLAASAGDGTTFRASDKAITITTIKKSDVKIAMPGK